MTDNKGLQGIAGETGDTGPQGVIGPRGPQGSVTLPRGLVYKVIALMIASVLLISATMTYFISKDIAKNTVSNQDVALIQRLSNDSRKAARQARVSCERTIKFSPEIGRILKENGFPPNLLKLYYSTIPKSCS